MNIIAHPISRRILEGMLPGYFGDMVKAVVDIRLGLIGLDAELHADIETEMLSQGSLQPDLWGVNIYPSDNEIFVEFDSLINIRPYQNNPSRDVLDPDVRQAILDIVNEIIIND
ncbi:MAG: hypothetical protein IJU72_05620, partial [Bacteroidales bacterium]|nr:hypothetical protein [Bacteroidales bacterium]